MNASKILLIGSAITLPVVGGIAYFQYAKSSIDFAFNGIDFPNSDLSNILHVKIKFDIHSTLGFPFTIISGRFNIFNDNKMIGTAITNQPLKVPNKATVRLEADTYIYAGELGNAVFNFLVGSINSKKDAEFLIKGEAKVRLDLPFLRNFVINIPVDETYGL